MLPADLSMVASIAEQVHPDYPEDPAVFAERLALFPAGCFMFGAVGYLIAHPWMLASPPQLNTLLGALPAAPDTMFVHDLALLPEARGRGHAGEAVALILRVAGPLELSLVSVGLASGFWRRYGFAPVGDAAVQASLSRYGAGACLMVRQA